MILTNSTNGGIGLADPDIEVPLQVEIVQEELQVLPKILLNQTLHGTRIRKKEGGIKGKEDG